MAYEHIDAILEKSEEPRNADTILDALAKLSPIPEEKKKVVTEWFEFVETKKE